ncbi:MAG: hypothetical protein ACXWXH_03610 [Aeromicrobium sp.]
MIPSDAAFATQVSFLFIGWTLVIYGVIALAGGWLLIGKGGFWSVEVSGALMVVRGLLFLRNTGAAALTLTLLAGAVLTAGIVRLMAAFHDPLFRVPLVSTSAKDSDNVADDGCALGVGAHAIIGAGMLALLTLAWTIRTRHRSS